MRQVPTPGAAVSRRHWIALAIATLTGCGGGSTDASGDVSATGGTSADPAAPASGSASQSADTQHAAATPGTGGTGISVLGPISGFGSIVINGVHYDESGARITLDGAGAGSGALRLGMVADVQGTRAADGLTGVAQSIDIWSIAQGAVSDAGSGRFTVMGMNIIMRSTTFVDVAGPSVGQRVAVWGLQADASGGQWLATRVDAASGDRSVVTGTVAGSGDSRTINGVRLTGDRAGELSADVIYRVEGEWDAQGQELRVATVRRVDVRRDTSPGKVVEIEGVVTSPLSGGLFSLGSVRVDASAVAGQAAALRIGQEIEVYGRWQGSVLVATKLEAEDEEEGDDGDDGDE
jgi:Domain of unknown function (DUF5666)